MQINFTYAIFVESDLVWPHTVLISLVNTFVLSIIDYCDSNRIGLTESKLLKLQSLELLG